MTPDLIRGPFFVLRMGCTFAILYAEACFIAPLTKSAGTIVRAAQLLGSPNQPGIIDYTPNDVVSKRPSWRTMSNFWPLKNI